jgi:hypothetical protein
MAKVKSIGERISWFDHGDHSTVIVSSKIESWKETLLFVWAAALTFSLVYFYLQLFGNYGSDQKIYLVVMVSFLTYFTFRIWKAFLWRKFGMEFFRVDDEKMVIKKSIGKYGKAINYFHDNIKEMEVTKQKEGTLSKEMNSSFWVVGGETLAFTYLQKQVKFGRQLNVEEANELMKLLKSLRSKHRKVAS